MSAVNGSPKRQQVRLHIEKLIEEKALIQGDKLPTEKQLCAELGVSRITVQSALETLQKEGKVYRIQGGGTFVGTVPTATARAPEALSFIPFVINNHTPHYGWLELIAGAEDYLRTRSCYVTVHSPNGDHTKEKEIIRSLVNRGARSLIILPVQGSNETRFYFDLLQQGIHLVFVDMVPRGLVGNLVCSNNVLGAHLVTKHLLEQGYHRIALVSGEQSSSVRDRITGYRFALEAAGYPVDEQYIHADNTIRSRRDVIANAPRIADKLLSLPEPPDAIFCINDYTATDLYHALTARGVRVPDDLALAGFDNLPITAENEVPITTVAQDFRSIGYEAARLCYEASNTTEQIYDHRYLPVRLIVRESTKKKG